MAVPFADRVDAYIARVDQRLDSLLPSAVTAPATLHSAMRYAVFNGGKRIRPLLVYASGECVGVDPDLLDGPAAAVELLHAFSLVHDDLPAMDDDDLRRGKPTVHRAYDEATAILAADALQPLAFSALSRVEAGAVTCRQLIQLFADACGSLGMTGGQSLDLDAEGGSLTRPEIEHMYGLKTGALIHAAIASACILHGALDETQSAALDRFGRRIGIVFQIRDDILDVEGHREQLGKHPGADERLEKATYPGLFGADAAHRRSRDLLDEALTSLEVFGSQAEPLAWLAHVIVDRSS